MAEKDTHVFMGQHQNILVLIGNAMDPVAIAASRITIDPLTLVVVAHGNNELGIQKISGSGFYTAFGIIKILRIHVKPSHRRVVFVSCRIALSGKGKYCQTIADTIAKPVYSASEFGWVHPSGLITVAGDRNNGKPRILDQRDPGRFIKFQPGTQSRANKPLQRALAEQAFAPESGRSLTRNADLEFGMTRQSSAGGCIHKTLLACLP
jgi:hypothetical protein